MKLIQYIKDLFKPKFRPSKQDLLILDSGEIEDENNDDKASEINANSKIFITIYNEAKLKAKSKNYFKIYYVDFTALDSYAVLLDKGIEFREPFLYYLIDIVKNEALYGAHIEKLFKVRLFGVLLGTKIKFTNTNLGDFFLFWRSEDAYSSHIPSHIIMREITKLSKKKNINSKLIKTLENYLTATQVARYNTFHNHLEKVQRIVVNYKFDKQPIPFFLVEDYFGKKVNKILLTLEKDTATLVSEFLKLCALKSRSEAQEKKIEMIIQDIGYDFFIEVCIQVLEIASTFKNKMAIRHFWAGHPKRFIKQKDYFGMFNENLTIVYGLIQTIQNKTLIEKIPIDIIVLITKRSYTLKQELRLSKSATKLGDLCINFLYTNYGQQGIIKLKKIYDEIPYKRVRNTINRYLPSVN